MADASRLTSLALLRWALGVQSVAAAVFSLAQWKSTVAFNTAITGQAGAPLGSAVAVALLLAGGVSLLTNRWVRAGSACLLVFLVVATVRHGLVAADISAVEPLGALAKRGQLASLAKNVPLIAAVVTILLQANERLRSARTSGSAPKAPE
ncbi:MAG: hypothetical protein AAGF12_00885 [Myxococcota bacterium]